MARVTLVVLAGLGPGPGAVPLTQTQRNEVWATSSATMKNLFLHIQKASVCTSDGLVCTKGRVHILAHRSQQANRNRPETGQIGKGEQAFRKGP